MHRHALPAFLFLALIGCGGQEIGEPCESVGSPKECVVGAICDKADDTGFVCRQLCEVHEDCDMRTEKCSGVSGDSSKSCHPK